ncbi:MAG TPA: septum formation initiator family protein [Acetobacterium sp.]
MMLVFIFGFTAYLFASNAIKFYELQDQQSQLVQRIEEEKIRSNQLDEQVKQIGSKSYVEFVARKYLGLYYPDEVIVIPVEAGKDGASNDQTIGK